MKLESLVIKNVGFVHCKSCFYSAHDVLSNGFYFSKGRHFLHGDIDSGVWAVSYLLSMYEEKNEDFVLSENGIVNINDTETSLHEVLKYSCYMDPMYSLFSSSKSVHELISEGLELFGAAETAEDIRTLFELDEERFERPLSGVGNERFRAMAAIGYVHQKELYCFPWLSQKRFHYYRGQLIPLVEKLVALDKTMILPIGN